MTKQTNQNATTQLGGADQYRLLLLIEQLQRSGKTEAEISAVLEEETRDYVAGLAA